MEASISNSKFLNNQALLGKGGAIYLTCPSYSKDTQNCNHSLINNTFSFNQAQKQGGAISYDLFSPQGLVQQNAFFSNQAFYGNDYGSYPFRLRLVSTPLKTLASGEIIKNPIRLGIFDQDDQLVTSETGSEGKIIPSDATLEGINKQIARQGVYEFNDIQVIAQPNYSSLIVFESNALQVEKIEQVTGVPFQQFSMKIYFRDCEVGEVVKNNQCFKCTKGFYSFSSSDSHCMKCFDHASCQGGSVTHLEPGYWRSRNDTQMIFQCPQKQSCLGGLNSRCEIGYSGPMCNVCTTETIDGNSYGRQGAYSCVKCPNLLIQALQIIGISIGLLLYVAYLLNSILMNPKRNKPQTVLVRILTNYFQAIMIAKELDLSWPTQVEQALNTISIVTGSQEIIVSLDCLFQKLKLTHQTIQISTFYIKVLTFGLLPIIFSAFAWVFWKLIQLYYQRFKNHQINFFQNATVTSFIIIYLMYPTITNLSFSLFNCVYLDDGYRYLRRELSIQCWTTSHLKIAFCIGIPVLFLWVIGFPIYIFFKLRQNKSDLDNKDTILTYGLFFVGLNDNAYFWEVIINNVRKVIFIMSSTLLPSVNSTVKCLLGIFIILIQTNYLHRYLPYIDPRFNQIEYHSQYCTVISSFSLNFLLDSDPFRGPLLPPTRSSTAPTPTKLRLFPSSRLQHLLSLPLVLQILECRLSSTSSKSEKTQDLQVSQIH